MPIEVLISYPETENKPGFPGKTGLDNQKDLDRQSNQNNQNLIAKRNRNQQFSDWIGSIDRHRTRSNVKIKIELVEFYLDFCHAIEIQFHLTIDCVRVVSMNFDLNFGINLLVRKSWKKSEKIYCIFMQALASWC